MPANVHVLPWLPQFDILSHPNLRLFITHGGLLRYLSDKDKVKYKDILSHPNIRLFITHGGLLRYLDPDSQMLVLSAEILVICEKTTFCQTKTKTKTKTISAHQNYSSIPPPAQLRNCRQRQRQRLIVLTSVRLLFSSLVEALQTKTPLVGIPFANDQRPNLLRAQQHG